MPEYRVTIGGEEYTVEVPNPRERPVKAIVDGETVEVHVEDAAAPTAPMTAEPTASAQAAPAPTPTAAPTRAPVTGSGELTAPLPGTVVTIAVAEGDTVEAGQELLVLEAMKMKNPIRAKQGGTVTAVHVNVGDQVQHGAPLLTLEA